LFKGIKFCKYYPVGKIANKQSEGVRIFKYTPTDCFFGDFTHWDIYDSYSAGQEL